MSQKATPRELEVLLTAYVEDACDEAQCRRMDELIGEDPVVLAFYVDMMSMHAMLQWRYSAQPDEGGERKAESGREEFPISALPITTDLSDDQSPFTVNHSLYAAFGFFAQGMPLAYLVAAIILGIALWTGSLIPVSHGVQVVEHSSRQRPLHGDQQPVFVGQITGMVDCQWADGRTATIDRAHVPLGRKYALASGLMEITYDTGAKVILQGPCTYEVESTTGGFLSVGKLTARVEKKEERRTKNDELSGSRSSFLIPHSYFTVKTPTATITDLGTEFGVEVSKEGNTTSRVYRGSVRLQVTSLDGKADTVARVLHENQSARVEKDSGKQGGGNRMSVCVTPANPSSYVRAIPKITIKTLNLVDVVAGGNGFGKARNRGIIPNTGEVTDRPSPEGPGWDSIRSDGRYHKVTGMPFVDGVFVPDDRRGPVQLDSAGHRFTGFGNSDDRLFGYIWAGGEIPVPSPPPMSTDLDGINYGSPEHGALGMVANKGITFDLEAIRRANPGSEIVRFCAVAGNTAYLEYRAQREQWLVDIRVFVDGQPRYSKLKVRNVNAIIPMPIEVAIEKNDRFLTLVVSDAGDLIDHDRVIFGDPRLELATIPDLKSTACEAAGK